MIECPFCGSREIGHTGWRGSDPIYSCDQCGGRFDDEGENVFRDEGCDDDDEIQEYDGRPIVNRYNVPHD